MITPPHCFTPEMKRAAFRAYDFYKYNTCSTTAVMLEAIWSNVLTAWEGQIPPANEDR